MPETLTLDATYDAIEACEDRVAPILEHCEENARELCGRFYYDDDGRKRPLNLLARNYLTLMAHLAHRNPKHEATPKSTALRGTADTEALLLDTVSDELDRIKTTRLQLLRAFIGPMAVTKIGARTGGDLVKVTGRLYDRGMTYLMAIDNSDHLADHQARCRDELTWEGHRYRVPQMMAAESGLFNPDVIMSMPAVSEMAGGDRSRRSRPDMISKRNSTTGEEAVKMVELVDLIFYDDIEPFIVTIPGQRGFASDFLRIEPWQGPSRGPYEWLEFHPQPNQLYGMSVFAFMREGHDATNELFAKMLDQILRTRRLLVGPRSSSDDLDTARDSDDGDVLEVDDPGQMKNLDVGGLTPDFAPFSSQLMQWTNLQYVNLDVAGGGDPQTDKATIYQGQSASVNAIIEDLQSTLEDHESRVSRQMRWRLRQDPLLHRTLIRRLPGQEYMDVIYDARTREDDEEDVRISIRYGSMLRQDPQVKAANLIRLLDVAQRSVMVSIQSGGAWNTRAALELAGRWLGFDEIDELVNDPMLEAALQQRLAAAAGVTPPGQPGGQAPVNPEALYTTRPAGPGQGPQGRRAAQPQSNGTPRRQMAGAA